MPNKAIQNAKRLRAGGLGQSSRFYNIYGQQVGASNANGFKGGQGWTTHNPSIGSMLSLGIAKQNKNAGGNNICDPGPGPKSVCVCVGGADGSNNFVPGGGIPGGLINNRIGFFAPPASIGIFSPNTISGIVITSMFWDPNNPGPAPSGLPSFWIRIAEATGTIFQTSLFSSISFINCSNNTVRTYDSASSVFLDLGNLDQQWIWDVTASGISAAEEQTFWSGALGKTLKVVINDSTLATGNGALVDYCCSDDCNCDCRGPSGRCPCRSKVDANGIRKHC